MKLTQGLNRDIEPVDQPEGSWRKAMNVMIDQQGAITNEFGFDIITWEENRIVIGTINTDTGVILFTVMYDELADPALDLVPKIYFVQGTEKWEIFNGDGLGLSPQRPVTGTFYRDTENVLNLIYTDNVHLRHLKVSNEKALNLLPSNFNLFPDIPVPIGNLINVEPGGSLQTGVYQFVFALEMQDGTITHYMNPTNWIHVIQDIVDGDYDKVEGSKGGLNSGKSITLEVSNLTTNFRNLHIGVVKRVEGQTFAYTLDPVPITNSTIIFSYSGGNENVVDVEKLVVPYQSYSSAKTLAIHNNRLYLGNLETNQVLKYQKFANNIQVLPYLGQSISVDDPVGSYKDPRVAYLSKSFLPGEVYAFYIRFVMKDGTYSPAFHIPGRVGTSTERQNNTTYSYINDNAKNFHFLDYGTANTMSYHENLDEQYPNSTEFDGSVDYDGNAIAGGRNLLIEDGGVKHHRFPTLKNLSFISGTATDSEYGIRTGTASIYTESNVRRLRQGTLTGYNTSNGIQLSIPYNNSINKFLLYNSSPRGLQPSGNDYACCISIATNTPPINGRIKLNFSLEIDLIGDPAVPHFSSGFELVRGDFSESTPEFTVVYSNYDLIPRGGNKYGLAVELNYSFPVESNVQYYVLMNLSYEDNINIGSKVNPYSVTLLTGSYNMVVERAFDEVSARGSVFVKPLLAKVQNIVIPEEIADKIQGYEILTAERSLGNSSILGQTTFHDHVLSNGNLSNTTYTRTYAFDMLANRPDERPTHVSFDLGLPGLSTLAEVDTTTGVTFGTNAYKVLVGGTDITGTALARKVEEFKYLPNDNVAVDVPGSTDGNRLREEAIGVKLDSEVAVVSESIDVLFGNVCVFRSNMYTSFFNQRLVKASSFMPVQGSGTYLSNVSGDSYISPYGIRLTYPTDNAERFYKFVCFSASNIGLRYEGDDWHEKYYPKSIRFAKGLWNYIPEGELNAAGDDVGPDGLEANRKNYARKFTSYYAYNKDYSALNNLHPAVVYNPNKIYADKFPYRVARSLPLNKEAQQNYFRLFQVLDYYEMPKNRGYITNLASLGPLLLIHHEYSLFRTVGKEKIVTDSAEVYLGTGDPFDRPPEELIPVGGGYAGTKAQQSCIVTKLGYFFVDNTQGRAFLVNDSIEEISAKGLRQWFRDFGVENSDNPHISTGYVAGYDQLYNRIILRLHGECGFTVSYSADTGSWLSFHSYKPRFFGFYQNNLYSGDSSLSKHNNPHLRCVYYVQVSEECYIEVVFPSASRSVLDSILWHSECWNRGIVNRTETFSHVTVYNSYQISGKVPLSYYNVSTGGNYRSFGNQFIFNGFRDMGPSNGQVYDAGDPNLSVVDTEKPWSERARFVDHYHIVRLYYDNPFAPYMNGIYLYSIQPTARPRI